MQIININIPAELVIAANTYEELEIKREFFAVNEDDTIMLNKYDCVVSLPTASDFPVRIFKTALKCG